MGNRKYRTVVAAVLAGAVLFSPLLCAMTRLEGCGVGPSAGVEFVPPVGELAAEFAESAAVGCVLKQVVSKIDFGGSMERVNVESLVRIGVDALRLFEGVWRRVRRWM